MSQFVAGKYHQRREYKSFEPNSINQPLNWKDTKINLLLEEANRELGELNAFSQFVPNVEFFIEMYVRKEANNSSLIEGTQTTLDEDLLPEEEISREKHDDWREVQNYIHTVHFALSRLKELPLSTRLLKECHFHLMQGVRGEKKQPGEIRVSQNWIGGTNLKNAFFIPPHHENVPELLGDLEKCIHNPNLEIPHLIKVALLHYQFETIHPFLDGNGRIGRLLITLYLESFGLLKKPTLYLSDFFAQHKAEYYDALTVVRGSNDIEHWIKFFLTAIIETAKKASQSMQTIVGLKKQYDEKIACFTQSKQKNAQKLLENLYGHPLITVNRIAKLCDVSFPTANSLVKSLEEMNILKEFTGQSRNRYFMLEEYMNAFRVLK